MTLAGAQRSGASLTAAPTERVPECHAEVGCITCGDEGIEMRALEVDAPSGLALCVDADGSTSEVDLGIVSGVAAGDALLVHAGVALTRLDAEGIK